MHDFQYEFSINEHTRTSHATHCQYQDNFKCICNESNVGVSNFLHVRMSRTQKQTFLEDYWGAHRTFPIEFTVECDGYTFWNGTLHPQKLWSCGWEQNRRWDTAIQLHLWWLDPRQTRAVLYNSVLVPTPFLLQTLSTIPSSRMMFFPMWLL